MPWDEDSGNDFDWTESHLKSRIQFYYDLKTNIKPKLAAHIRNLLIEAQYLQQQKQMLENEVDEQQDTNADGIEDAAKSNVTHTTILQSNQFCRADIFVFSTQPIRAM